MTLLAITAPFVFCFLNRVRGGFFPLKGGSAFLAGGLLALFIYAITFNAWAAGAFFVAYIAGESFGWGKWLAMLPEPYSQAEYNISTYITRKDGKNNGIHFLANKLVPETEDYYLYSCYALTIRGIYWMLPVFVALAVTGVIPWWGTFFALPLGFAFPFPYLIGLRFNREHYWGLGEYIYGFLQGATIGALLYIGA